MKNKLVTTTIASALLAASASVASAATIAVGATGAVFTGTLGTTHTLSGFTVAEGSDRKLVVTIGFEVGSSGTLSGITWNGTQSFVPAVVPGGTRKTTIWYLDAPEVATGNIVATFLGDARSRMGVVSLTNAAAGGPVVSNFTGAGNATISLTTTAPDTLVFGGITQQNGFGNPGNPSGFTQIYIGDSGSSNSVSGYINESTAGTKDYTWTTGTATGNDIGSIAVAGFVAVPEPSSAALLLGGIGVLAFARRRK
jgi:PEP-CTERM motif